MIQIIGQYGRSGRRRARIYAGRWKAFSVSNHAILTAPAPMQSAMSLGCSVLKWNSVLEKRYVQDKSEKDERTAHYPPHGRIGRSQNGTGCSATRIDS